MAAYSDDYYNSYNRQPQHDYDSSRRYDAPQDHTPSPYASPFRDDGKFAYSHPAAGQSYSGSNGQRLDNTDPFDDHNAIPMSGRGQKPGASSTTLQPILQPEGDDPFVRDAQPRKEPRKSGWFKGQITWVVYILTVVQLIVFIAELARNAVLTKTPIEIHPSFNPMIGPSPYLLINMGARYPACMHTLPGVQDATQHISWPCPDATSLTGKSVSCTLPELCGFSGNNVPDPNIHDTPGSHAPNQWWRFIIPIFIHAGIVHIAFNLLLQLTLGRDVEKLIGSIRFAIVYFASGIFGFVLGGNFAATGIASCGCSGSLFGILAITLLDLLYTWRQRKGPIKDLLFILVDVVIAFILGLLPGLDNFSHIGGFFMGLVLGVCILRSPSSITRNSAIVDPFAEPRPARYSGISPSAPSSANGLGLFIKSPRAFFVDRRGAWWGWLALRIAALVFVLIAFILLLKNFYVWRHTCHWCRYLSCLDIKVGATNWCDVGNLDFTPDTSTNGTSRI